ncbi:AlbA family DNA-binding domain-containing protein [Ectobacillus panaciterrae]|uniref:AlbA family DNA-binding domain-containing protein n=1 Tax=Ectobacillus panaciterrae TaxID=363872 RepID=UPI0003F9533F|nr:ATP-binding protein [Ectobacillus panaciterrae]
MKKPWKWTEEDLLSLIKNKAKESLTLEFKSCAALHVTEAYKKELSKDVSSFANAAGGTIIYGAIEENQLFSELDKGFDQEEISKEWIEQVLNASIHRRIKGLRIHPIELKTTNPGRFVYVICIPKSQDAPHMANDNRYYKRFNFQSIPMEEYEVRDIFTRPKQPDLLFHYFFKPQYTERTDNGIFILSEIMAGIHNRGQSIAKYPALSIKDPIHLIVQNEQMKCRRTEKENEWFIVGSGDDIIYPNTFLWMCNLIPSKLSLEVILDGIETPCPPLLQFNMEIFAEGMDSKRKYILITYERILLSFKNEWETHISNHPLEERYYKTLKKLQQQNKR